MYTTLTYDKVSKVHIQTLYVFCFRHLVSFIIDKYRGKRFWLIASIQTFSKWMELYRFQDFLERMPFLNTKRSIHLSILHCKCVALLQCNAPPCSEIAMLLHCGVQWKLKFKIHFNLKCSEAVVTGKNVINISGLQHNSGVVWVDYFTVIIISVA